MKSEKELYKIWKKYIDRPIYRVIPSRDIKNIKKNGINPNKNPFEKYRPLLNKLFDLVLILERAGYNMTFKWGNKESSGYYAVRTFRNDLSKNFVDFGTKKMVEFYLNIEGGALVRNIKRITKRIIEEKPLLSRKDSKLVRGMNKLADRMMCKNVMISVRGKANFFETAIFQLLGKDKRKTKTKYILWYLESPFGSFEHFKRVIRKNGLNKYLARLKNEKFYLRVRAKIPAKEINYRHQVR